jgi:glycosyltransferase involved in cell wall biosynthesis
VIYFDERQHVLKDVYPDAEYIPFPCFPIRRGDKTESRKRLDLPRDKKIIFTFCQRGYRPYLRYLCEALKLRAVLLFVIPPDFEMLEKESAPPWMIVREEGALSDERFDEYLFASDAVIFHKYQNRYLRLLSATIFQAMGAGCPICIPQQSEYFQPLKDEVIYYSDTDDMCRKLTALCEDDRIAKSVIEAEEVYTDMRSAEKIAEIYIDVFTAVLKGRGL